MDFRMRESARKINLETTESRCSNNMLYPLTSWFWYAVTAVKTVSGKTNVLCCSVSRSVIGR